MLNIVFGLFLFLLVTEKSHCVVQDGWIAWLYDASPLKAYHSVRAVSESQWVKMWAPDLSMHSRSVTQGVMYTCGTSVLCLAACRFPALKKVLQLVHYKWLETQRLNSLSHNNSNMAIKTQDDPFSTPPRRGGRRHQLRDLYDSPLLTPPRTRNGHRVLQLGSDDGQVALLDTPPRKRRLAIE